MTIALALLTVLQGAASLPSWEFEDDADAQVWVANSHLANAEMHDGVLSADAIDWDPFFHNRAVEIAASPYQYVVIRMRADRPGLGELFWSGTFEGEYGGLTQHKKTQFKVPGDGARHDLVVFPFWHADGVIRQIRLDVYEGTHFEIDSIRVLQWGEDAAEPSDATEWTFDGDVSPWHVHPEAAELFAGPVRLDVSDRGWVAVRLRAGSQGTASVLWACEGEYGMQSRDFAVRGDGEFHTYNVELQGIPSWRDPVVAFGVRLPASGDPSLDSIAICDQPSGPPELDVTHFGFENAPNRAGMPCRLLLRVTNRGGEAGSLRDAGLDVPDGVQVANEPSPVQDGGIEFDEYQDLVWELLADKAGEYDVEASLTGDGAPREARATLRFTRALDMPKADYVPEPRPVETDIDVCMFYFPGWNADAKWDCIRNIAPIRKPVLGYYDEGNPECVDWQIKWAVENGISCFLVDWYWNQGAQHLTHWFEAYRKARYRDYLPVAIMWANHLPPGSHSMDDWRTVTRHWIDRYFTLDTYYRIDGKPAVFIWDPRNIRNDIGGSDIVRSSLEESQAMAREAGYEGISFVALNVGFSTTGVKELLDEGYCGITTYHEWGAPVEFATSIRRQQYADLVATAPDSWAGKDELCGELTYHPVVDTGWDSRPWHGDRARVIEGRTADLFEDLLRTAKTYCAERGKRIVVLGPANEWGEGSYVEPCTEFGFDMYERVRKVFAKGDPASWPVNVAPVDVGLGPYDFPPLPLRSTWQFEDGREGWEAMMGAADFRCEDGALRFRAATRDPALLASAGGLQASKFHEAEIRMRVTGDSPATGTAQLFWSSGGSAISEATSVRFPVTIDGQFHTYRVDLSANPRWRGRISSIRFDPCDAAGAEVTIDEIRLVPRS